MTILSDKRKCTIVDDYWLLVDNTQLHKKTIVRSRTITQPFSVSLMIQKARAINTQELNT
jgi:hypothetical protein